MLHISTRKITAFIFRCCIAACFITNVWAGEKSPCLSDESLVFGFLPLLSAEKLVRRFAPLVNYLSKNMHSPIRIETAPDFREFIRRTNHEKRFDLLFTAPHFFYHAKYKADYFLLATVDSPSMTAVIAAPSKSDIHTVKDLAGKQLATVDPLGLATLLVKKYLLEHGIDPDKDLTFIVTPTHNASLLSSYYGVADASALMMPPYREASAEVREKMRIIATTDSSPHMPISAGPWVSNACRKAITAVLLNMNNTTEGKKVLKQIRFPGFAQPDDEIYEQLEWAAAQINIE